MVDNYSRSMMIKYFDREIDMHEDLNFERHILNFKGHVFKFGISKQIT